MKKDEILRFSQLTEPLLRWYRGHRRILPWREEVSPYRTWVSEIMLQQTRVSAMLPYFERFMKELPDAESLAEADDEKLMKLWQGLGYYSRARNLKRAAEEIVRRGAFPADYAGLTALPGIGDYTAGAILSIAFHEPVPAVDGNVLRIVSRVTGNAEDIADAAVKKAYRALVEETMSRDFPGEYNQALMDLGAMVCLPGGEPRCADCPARDFCAAHQTGRTGELPVKTKKKPRRVEEKTVFLLLRDGKIALHKRSDEGLLAGLWEFPNTEGALDEREAAGYLLQHGFAVREWKKALTAKHIFTHVEWHMRCYVLSAAGEGEGLRWCDAAEFEAAAIPSAFERLIGEANELFAKKEKKEEK